MAVRRSRRQMQELLAKVRAEIARLGDDIKLAHTSELLELVAEQVFAGDDVRRYELLVAHSRDIISERKRAEESLLRERAVLDGIIKATDVMLVYLDRDFNFVAVNPAYAATCRMRPEDMIGKNHFDLYPHEENEAIFRRVRDTGIPVFFKDKPFEFPDQPERGVTYWDWSLTPIKDASGQVVNLVFSLRETTSYRLAELALADSENRYRTLSEAVFTGIAVVEDGKHIDANDQLLRMFGYSRSEFLGSDVSAMVVPEHRDQVMARIRSQEESFAEVDVFRKDGRRITVETHGKTTMYRGRRVRITAIQDVTDRKRTEQERENTVQLLRLISEHQSVADLVRAATTFFQERSGCDAVGVRLKEGDDYPYYEARGFSKEFVLAETHLCARDEQGCPIRDSAGMPVLECMCGNVICGRFDPSLPFFTPYGSFWTNSTTEMLAGTSEADRQCHTRNQFNKAGYESVALIPLRIGDDRLGLLQLNDRRKGRFSPEMIALWERLAGYLAVALAKAQAEEALRQSEQQLRRFIDSAPVAIAMFDTEMRYLAASHRWLVDHGLAGQDVLGHSHYEVLPQIPDRWKEVHRRCLTGAVESSEEDRFELADGSIRWWRWEVQPWRHADGDVGGLIIYVEDATARKNAEQQLINLNATLEQRVAQRTAEADHRAAQLQRLAAELTGAEHRERKRLAQILHDHLQQLLVGAKLGLGRARNYAGSEVISETLQEVDRLIGDSLTTSRSLTAELSPMILQEGSMPDILRWLARWAQEKYGLSVRVRVSPGADIEAAELRIVLFAAVRELLLNTIKHAAVREARIGLRRCFGQRVLLIVADRGVGFDARSERQVPSAGGFGLFSIQERLDVLGGKCHIASAPGKGTRVSLIVPRSLRAGPAEMSHAPMPVPIAPAAEQALGEGWSPQHPIRVLLVDDHAVVRDGIASLLQLQPDIQVAGQASDGQQAVDLAAQFHPDVILMDVSMPRGGGIEATRQIIHQVPGSRVIGLSMYEQEDIAAQMAQAGAVGYLTKTAPPETVIAAIYQAAGQPGHAST